MDQLGKPGRKPEEQGTEGQSPNRPDGEVGAPLSLAIYRAVPVSSFSVGLSADGTSVPPAPAAAPPVSNRNVSDSDTGGYPDGFSGLLALQNIEVLDGREVGGALDRMAHLICWGQAQQARLLHRMEDIFRDGIRVGSERVEPGLAFSLAAAECAAILNVPHCTAQRMMDEAGDLCGRYSGTLESLEAGHLSYAHAQVVIDQCQSIPVAALPEFEADLLKAADGQTRAQFSARARRMRDKKYPETVTKRHLTAFEKRRVTLDREDDGMSCLSAHLPAEHAQQIFTMLSTAARGEKDDGDARTTDQLRTDILAQLLLGAGGMSRSGTVSATQGRSQAPPGKVKAGHCKTRTDAEGGAVPRAEIMVLINAETLFGADDSPAELHGYGPISAEAARRLARNALYWTGLARDPDTGEILGVGRRRKVPQGLRRWLRARDGTCRFPGCRVNTANSEVDHTKPWAQGGNTEHGNLEHLCRRHHRFKTLGFWEASQPRPGVIEWSSPTGRIYRTDPYMELAPPAQGPALKEDAIPPF